MTKRDPTAQTPTDPTGSMSLLLQNWTVNENQIAEKIDLAYFPQLKRLARQVLGGLPGAAAEADDVVQSAIKSLCLFMRRQSSTLDKNRDDVWRLLCYIAKRKAKRRLARQTRGLRGGRVHPLTDMDDGEIQIDDLLQPIPPDEFDLIVRDAIEQLDESLKPIALMVMEGRSQTDISELLGCSRRTVIRKFELIKRLLKTFLAET